MFALRDWWRSGLCVALLMGPVSAPAQSVTEEYRRTLSQTELDALARGASLDDSDAEYCEKARDLCLIARCGADERSHVPDACWEHCTRNEYTQCRVRQ